MNHSSSIIKKVHSFVCSKIKKNLDNLFEYRKFNIHDKQTVYTIKDKYIFEDIDTCELFFEQDLNNNNEYIIYNIRSIINKLEFKELYYNLHIIKSININSVDFLYKPDVVYIENQHKLNIEIFQEYFETYNLFKNIRIFNHNNNYDHRLSFSLNGHLYNRPDREYYIVLNNNYNFNIQVYKLDQEHKRERMLFGILMNITSCGKNMISEPFFL